jgi:hypothetical protein
MSAAASPLPDVLDEARRLVALADARDVELRLLGGTAIRLRGGERLLPVLRRAPQDIDVAVPARGGSQVAALLTTCGYRPDEGFNRLEGARRMLFHDVAHGRQLDVFVRDFAMCHRIPIDERLLLEPGTLPLAELMLTKLQIVELNAKDRIDLYAMLQAHEVAAADGTTINARRIAELCARDWGLHRTATINLGRLGEHLVSLEVPDADRRRIAAGIERIGEEMETAPKSRGWRMRARVGERVRWYEEPDEVGEA